MSAAFPWPHLGTSRRSFLLRALGLALGGTLTRPVLAAPSPAANEVLPGIDALEANGFSLLRGKRVGLISNPTGINRRGEATWRVLRRAPGVKLVSLFGAEHGFDGSARAGVEVPPGFHPECRLPIHSLYGPGPTRKPTPAMLEDLDVLVYDLQDTGCRSYTYISTLGFAMEACGEAGREFVVLDRPNPLGGLRVEGPSLNPRFRSFVGQWPIPYAYGLTPGELARMINGERWIQKSCRLTVVPLRRWTRAMTWPDTRLTWIPSSPNVPRGESPLYLVATGMLGEIGGLNLGTGTGWSFQIIAGGWVDPEALATKLNSYRLPGVVFTPIQLDLNRQPQDGNELKAVRLSFTRPATAPLVAINCYVLEAVKRLTGRDLFRQAVANGKSWTMFDKVTGSDLLRRDLQVGRAARDIVASWRTGENDFRQRRRRYLLYPEKLPGKMS